MLFFMLLLCCLYAKNNDDLIGFAAGGGRKQHEEYIYSAESDLSCIYAFVFNNEHRNEEVEIRKVPNFTLNMMNLVFKMMDFALKMMDFALKAKRKAMQVRLYTHKNHFVNESMHVMLVSAISA